MYPQYTRINDYPLYTQNIRSSILVKNKRKIEEDNNEDEMFT